MSKKSKQFFSVLLAIVMMLGMILPNLPAVTSAKDGDETYAQRWPMTGAEYTVYTSENAARNALDKLKNEGVVSTVGMAKTTSDQPGVFHIQKDGTKFISETLEFDVNKYWVIETKVPKGWNLDETVHEMNVVPGGQAVNIADGYVYSKETPDFFKFYPYKDVMMQSSIDTKAEYLAKYPITGAKYAIFTDKAKAEDVQQRIYELTGSTSYAKTVDYTGIATDVDGNPLLFVVADNEGTMVLDGTDQTYAWIDEDITYYMIEVERPVGYYFDSNIYTIHSKGNETVKITSTELEATTWLRVNKAWLTDAWVQDVNPGEYNLGITWAMYKADKTTLVATGKTNPTTGEMICDTVYPYDGKPAVEVPLGIYWVHEEAIDLNSGKCWADIWKRYAANEDKAINNLHNNTLENAPFDPHFEWGLSKTLSAEDEQFYTLSLQGTQFTVYYFLDDELTESDLFETITVNEETGETRKVLKDSMKSQAAKRWVLEAVDQDVPVPITLEDGTPGIKLTNSIAFDEHHKVGGDDYYYNNDGVIVALIGTYVFEETKTTIGFGACDSWLWNCLNNVENANQDFTDYITMPPQIYQVIANKRQTIQIEIQKSSNNSDKPNYYGTLAGAQFKLEFYNPLTGVWENASATDLTVDSESEYILTTDSNGKATSLPMKPGKYRLTEIKAPDGHTLNHGLSGVDNNGVIEFTLEEALNSIENNGQRNFVFKYDSNYTDALTNHTTFNVLDKVGYSTSGSKELLAGATVQLWELEDGVQKTQLKINGQTDYVTTGEPINLYGLSVGKTYRFIEVKQPEGYLMPQGEEAYVDFTIADDDAEHDFELLNEKIPSLRSKAFFDTGIKEATADADVKLVDHFWASDLLPNKTYTFKNVKLRDANENVVASADDVTFTTDSISTEYDVVFNFHSSSLAAGQYTVTGELHRDDRPIITKVQTHYDMTDWDETITKVEIGTHASDKAKSDETAAKFIMNDTEGVIVDRVDYEGAIGGSTYKVVAKLVDEVGTVINEVTTTTTIPANGNMVSGSFNVEIPVDATKYNGHTLTVFEYIYNGETLIAKHEDLADMKQQVQIPEVKTIASETVVTNEENKEDYWFELTDVVMYNHIPGDTDMIGTMTVMDKETQQPLVDEAGNTYSATYEFTTDLSGAGTFSVSIKIPYSLVEGKTFSVFEGIKTAGGIDIAHHYEWDDKDQTVNFPMIRTEGWFINKDGNNEVRSKHVLDGTDTITILDDVTIKNTVVGETYVVSGTVELVDAEGNVSTLATSDAKSHIVAEGEEESFIMTMDFKDVVTADFTKLDEGAVLVITENLYHNNELVGRHYQLTDAKQTLRSPDYFTTATDKSDGDKYVFNDHIQYAIDHFTYTDVTPGVTQKVVTYLVDQFGEELLDSEGKRYEVVTEFTPESTSGAFDILIPFDAKHLEGKIVTVFEDIYEGDALIGVHHDLSQETQTVYVPYVRTHGSYATISEDNQVEITDILEFKNLPVGEDIYGKITLMDLETKAPLQYNGEEVSKEFTFSTDVADGSYEVKAAFDVEALREKKFVIFEELYRHVTIEKLDENGEPVEEEVVLDLAEHKDWEDKDQTILMPSIQTEAADAITENHDGIANSAVVTIVDHVYGYNLKPNHAYTLVARLADAKASSDDEVVFVEIDPVEITFVTPEDVGEVYEVLVPIEVPAPLVVNKKVVAFESLIDGNVELAFHNDIKDEDQSVTYTPPTVKTEAADNYTEERIGYRNAETIVMVDDVTMTGLLPNYTYTLNAQIINKDLSTEDNLVFVNATFEGEVFTTPADLKLTDEYVVTIKAYIPVGEVEVGSKLVAAENLYDESTLLAMHVDVNDEPQTVEYKAPEVKTTAIDDATEDHNGYRNAETITILDDVRMTGLLADTEYRLVARVIDKTNSTEDEIAYVDGIVVEHVFTTPADLKITDEWTETVTIEIPATMVVVDNDYVAAETLYIADVELATHVDADDVEQTVKYEEPTIKTTALDDDTKTHTGYLNAQDIVLTDTVVMTGLLPAHTYTLDARVINKTLSTDETIVYVEGEIEGAEFTTPETLKPSDEYSVVVTFTIPMNTLEVGTKLVAAETLYDNGIELATHVDLNDEDQTVEYDKPVIYTTAELDSPEDVLKNDELKVVDTVYYSNLKVGQQYTLRATAVIKSTGEKVRDAEGKPYEFIVDFVPETPDGYVRVPMVFKQLDVNGLTIVAFEKLFIDFDTEAELEIASHEDVEDENQTVKLPFEVKITVAKRAAGTGYYLKGAEISILDKDGNVVKDKYGNDAIGLTDANGLVVFEIYVDDDTQYFAKETKAPAGYQLNDSLFELKKNELGIYTADIQIQILDEVIIIPPSPATGDNSNIGLWIGLMGASLLGVLTFVILGIRKKKSQEE